MESWGLAFAGTVLLITVVQLVAYYYLLRSGKDRSLFATSAGEGPGNATTRPPESLGADERRDRSSDVDSDDLVVNGERGPREVDESDYRRCSECGAPNENVQTFTFCRNCAARL